MPVQAEPLTDFIEDLLSNGDEELPLNSRQAMQWREQTALERLVEEILYYAPDYAEQLMLDGLNRMRH
jgi:hypothetical protein